MKGLVRTAFDDGVRPARPTVTKWRVESGRLEPEEVRLAWQYAIGDAFPWPVEAVPGALLAFTPEAIVWCAGHPRVRHRSGTAAVDEVLRQLVTQSAAAAQHEERRLRSQRRDAEAARDADDALRARARSQKATGWRLGRSPGSFGGTRMS
jgi:hypothetical protein